MTTTDQQIAAAIKAAKSQTRHIVKEGNAVDIFNPDEQVIAEIRRAHSIKTGVCVVADALDAISPPSLAEGFTAAVILYDNPRGRRRFAFDAAKRAAHFAAYYKLPVKVFVCDKDRPAETFKQVFAD